MNTSLFILSILAGLQLSGLSAFLQAGTAGDALFPSDFSVAVAVSIVAEGCFP